MESPGLGKKKKDKEAEGGSPRVTAESSFLQLRRRGDWMRGAEADRTDTFGACHRAESISTIEIMGWLEEAS